MTTQINHITGDAAFAVDKHGTIVSWNTEAEHLFGYPENRVLGQRCWQLLEGQDVHGNRYCCKSCPLREMALRHEPIHGVQTLLKTASNGRKKFTMNSVSVLDSPGDALLLHICHSSVEVAEQPVSSDANNKPSANYHRGGLTNREIEVLALLADGKTTHEIASLMCISDATVRNHIQHTLYKLHVHNRLEAVMIGQRLAIV